MPPASHEETPISLAYSASSSPWTRMYDRLKGIFRDADPRVCISFWLFGLVNNVLYVIILSAALDLVGPDVPTGVVLLADIIPAFTTKLVAPYFIHLVPYSIRVVVFVLLSFFGMLIVAMSPSYADGGTMTSKIAGIVLASLSAGGGELSFVGLTHFYGPFSLAAWGSGTGAAGLVGAGAYAVATSAMGISVQGTLFASACLPLVMAMGFFVILPRDPLQSSDPVGDDAYAVERGAPIEEMDEEDTDEAEGLLGVSYVINQGVAPTLVFPIDQTPFEDLRSFYPTYNAIYQVGVFLSRSSTPFFRVHHLYVPSILQVVNLVLLTLQSMYNFIPSIYIVFVIIFWEGLLGGLVYVNTFAEISDRVPKAEREFSLGATTVSDSAGICIAGLKPANLRLVDHVNRANKHGPPLIRTLSARVSGKLTTWQTTVVIFLWLYVCRNFAKIVGLECPEPLANLYSRSFFRATWITTGLDAGFWTAMTIKPKWLRDLASLVFTAYYLIAAEQADEKVRRVRATLTLEHLRVSWNKATTPYLWALASLVRPRLTRYAPRAIRIPRPMHSVHQEPVSAWLYFDGPLSALREQTSLVLDVPGGGFVAMGPRNSEDKLLSWTARLKVPVLSIDYKKAPEFAYPYALHECYDVYHTIIATNGRCLGLSGRTRPRIIVTGESAGGNLAVGMTLMVLQSAMAQGWRNEDGLPRPDGLVLAYPALNVRVESWMTEEQMSLIQDKGSRQTNKSVLQRKEDQYRKLTPFTSPGPSVDDLPTLAPKQPTGSDQPRNVASEASKALRDKLRKIEDLNGDIAGQNDSQPQPLQTRIAVSSMISYVHDRILTPEMMRAMIILYIGPHHRPDFNTDFYLSPVLAPDALLAGFPKTYILTGERDPLVDDTVIFAGRLRQAKFHHFSERQDLGLERSQYQFNEKDHVEVSLIPGVSHGFLQMAGFFPEAWKYINRSAQWIENLFDSDALRESDLNLLQLSNTSESNVSQHWRSRAVRGASNGKDYHQSHPRHRRTLTGESSGDEERPLEMGMTRATASSDNDHLSDQPLRRRKSRSLGSSQLTGYTTLDHSQSGSTSEFLAQLKHLELTGYQQDLSLPYEVNSAPESLTALRPRGRSITSLGSEEDLLDRRMNGLAGGLMGLGERAQTPGP
ncbi:uncharacterized protein N7459_008844 [Penicillium hispanicum]|uniref:uncharacterized protein n=1 Tax=Penicillium hispanicum TaxID=1080232 RepID=UPI0025419CA9|nr:uncharacterized protein N7459_008844 [Penicillium hispanicum]KAJ5569414.1 hypothetical protein N7459_008844 [Penicillium hispanicum]